MRTSRVVLLGVCCWLCLFWGSQSVAYTVVSFSGEGAPKACAGDNFGDAVSKGGQRPSYYGSNFATGFKCPSKVSSSIDPLNKHAHSQSGYLFVYGGSLHAKVSSSWNPPSYYGEVIFYSCRHCRFGGDAIGWHQWSYSTYECSTNAMPRWAFDSEHVESVELQTSGGNVIGGTVNLKAPDGGVQGQTGEWNDYDFNTPPQWVWYPEYDPEGGGGDGVPEAQDMNYWTQSKVGNIVSGVLSIDDRLRLMSEAQESRELLRQIFVTDWYAARNNSELSNQAINNNLVSLEYALEGVKTGIIGSLGSLQDEVNASAAGIISAVGSSGGSSDGTQGVDISPLLNAAVPDGVTDISLPSIGGKTDGFMESDLEELGEEVDRGLAIVETMTGFVQGVALSLVGSWSGVGRSAPGTIVNVTFPIIGAITVDYHPELYGAWIEFARAVMAAIIWLSCLFASGRLISSLFGGE